ncbi:hypothetical protein DIREPILLOW8_19 [Vibrio phage Direpillow8]|nr:hypothetical protein DIREPILLOW8_19 [Vibrio phage Direpillow8]WBF69385.1 hypothetical protein IW18_14 [Vibrio phage IW18]
MALFMGRKPSDNRPLLHVTSGSESISQLHGAPIASTLFHSDIPYLAISKVIEVTQFKHVEARQSGTRYYHYYEPVIPQEVWNYMNQGYLMCGSNVSYHPNYVEHRPIGVYSSDWSPTSADIFIGNFQGSMGGGHPYGGISSGWAPIDMHDMANADETVDQAVRIQSDSFITDYPTSKSYYRNNWSISGLAPKTKNYKRVIQSPNVSASASRATSASFTKENKINRALFANGTTSSRMRIIRPTASAPTTLTYSSTSPSDSNFKLIIYIFNVKYNSSNKLEHVKPDVSDGIRISREDMVVGDLAMKNGMFITDPAPNEDLLDSTISSHKYKVKYPFFDRLVKGLTLAQLADYPFPYCRFFKSSNGNWSVNEGTGWYNIDTILLVHSPSALLGTGVSLDFSADEIKYKGSKGEYLIASKARKYTPFVLGGDSAITAVFPAETNTFAQLKQGTSFKKEVIDFGPSDWRRVLNPDQCGNYYKTVVKQRIKLPPGSTNKSYLSVHVSSPYLKGEASSTIAGKTSKMNVGIDGYSGWSNLQYMIFSKDHPDKEAVVSDIGFSTMRDVSKTSSDRSWWYFSSTGNKMQAVRIQYKIRVNWVRNELELVGWYKLTNAALQCAEYSGKTTYYNKLGERDVTYKTPEVRLGFYILGTA